MPIEPRTPAIVAAEIADQFAARATAEAELDRLAAARPAMLLDLSRSADARLDAHDTAMARQRRAIERADAVTTQLAPELERLQADEDHAARAALYASGQEAASEVVDLVLNDYLTAAAAVVEVLHRIGAAKAIVARANAALPAGARAIHAEGFRSDRGPYAQPAAPLDATVVLPGARASDGTVWPPPPPAPYDPAAERRQREQERARRDEAADLLRREQESVPKAIRTVMSADEFGLPAVTVTQPTWRHGTGTVRPASAPNRPAGLPRNPAAARGPASRRQHDEHSRSRSGPCRGSRLPRPESVRRAPEKGRREAPRQVPAELRAQRAGGEGRTRTRACRSLRGRRPVRPRRGHGVARRLPPRQRPAAVAGRAPTAPPAAVAPFPSFDAQMQAGADAAKALLHPKAVPVAQQAAMAERKRTDRRQEEDRRAIQAKADHSAGAAAARKLLGR